MTESDFQKKLIDDLESVGAFVFNVHGHGMQKSGLPDLQVYHPLWTGHLELKTGTKVSQVQQWTINTLRARGTAAFAVVLRDKELVVEDAFQLDDYFECDRRERVSTLLVGLRELSLPIWDKWWNFNVEGWRMRTQ